MRKPQIWLDCDGVLANFDKRAAEILGMPSRHFEAVHGSTKFWDTLYDTPNLFVDDWPKHMDAWKAKGGIWVEHKSAVQSIAELKELGIL